MKLKFVLVPLVVLGFAVGSYANCSKDEIMKLLDKGYSKSEVDQICGKSEKKKRLKWLTPSNKTCVNYGGKIGKTGRCEAKWSIAKNICSVLNTRLPTIYELNKVIIDCGGTTDIFQEALKSDTLASSCSRLKSASSFSRCLMDKRDNIQNSRDNNLKNSSYQSCYKRKGFAISNLYWSSNAHANDIKNAWHVDFYFGATGYYSTTDGGYVRCVREVQ